MQGVTRQEVRIIFVDKNQNEVVSFLQKHLMPETTLKAVGDLSDFLMEGELQKKDTAQPEPIDRKFKILAVNPVNGKTYTDQDAILLCAKDKAVPAALRAYRDKCVSLQCSIEHVQSIELLLSRVVAFQNARSDGGRVPDTVGAEIDRCLNGNLDTEDHGPQKELEVGDHVMVFDRYRFAIPAEGMVVEKNNAPDGVRVELSKSNSSVVYPVGSTIWVHEAQLRRITT